MTEWDVRRFDGQSAAADFVSRRSRFRVCVWLVDSNVLLSAISLRLIRRR